MFADPFVLVTVGAEFILMLLGAVVALQEDWAKAHRWWILAAFAVVGMSGVYATMKTAQRSAVANSKLSTSINQLGASAGEISRVTALNTSLQERLLTQSASISKLATESFRTITGADSFPYIAPQPAAYPGPVPLFVWDHGKYMLTGVTLTIRRSDDFNVFQAPLDIGILHPGWGKPLSTAIQPRPDPKTGEDIFLVEMYTQSDSFTEVIHFRRNKDGKYWAHKFWVQEHKFSEHTETPLRQGRIPPVPKNGSITFTVYDKSQWSDEPQNIKAKERSSLSGIFHFGCQMPVFKVCRRPGHSQNGLS